MAANWKAITLGVVIVAILATLYVVSKSRVLGFQSGGGPNRFVLYYADWCPHCQAVKPEFSEFAKQSPLTVGGTKCNIELVSPEQEPEKAAGKNIKGYPTFMLEKADGGMVEYKGSRNADGYLKFLNEQLGGGI